MKKCVEYKTHFSPNFTDTR